MSVKEQEVVDILGKVVAGQTPADEAQAQTALAIKDAVAVRLADRPAYAPLWAQFQAAPQAQAPVLAGVIQVILKEDPALADRLESLLAQYQQGGGGPTYHAEGGMFMGSVNVQHGDLVARDQEKTITHQGADPAALAQAFTQIYQQVAQQPTLAPQEKADVQAELQEVETELQKGAEADETFIQRRLRNVQRMAPEILDVVLTTFANPVLGLGMVAEKITDKMRADA